MENQDDNFLFLLFSLKRQHENVYVCVCEYDRLISIRKW